MKNLIVMLAFAFVGSSAFAYIDNFSDATKNARTVPVSSGQCQINVNDKINGLAFNSSEFEPVTNHIRPDQRYLSLWKFHLGTDNTNLLASVEPFTDINGKLLLHILIVNEPADHEQTGKQEIVELIGEQTSPDTVAFHGWSNNKFDYRDAGKQFDVNGSVAGTAFSVSGETAELKYALTCKF